MSEAELAKLTPAGARWVSLRSTHPARYSNSAATLMPSRWSGPASLGRRKENLVSGRDEIVVIAGARDRAHRGGVQESVLNEAFVDVNANDLTEHHVALSRMAF